MIENLYPTSNRIDAAGEITLDGKAIISDPAYNRGTWCMAEIDNILPGLYKCYADVGDHGEWDNLVDRIFAVHESIDDTDIDCDTKITATIGVDSGLCGIYNNTYFDSFKENWLEKIETSDMNHCADYNIFDAKAFVSHSGYGDGGYDCWVQKDNNGTINAIEIDFIID